MTTDAISSQTPLSTKLNHILGTSYTDYSIKSALECLGDQFVDNTPTARRQLRAQLELQEIQASGALLEQYEHVISVYLSQNLH